MAIREDEKEVEITVRSVGPGRPSKMRIPSPIRVCELRRLVASERHLPEEQLKLILRGRTLHDQGAGGNDLNISLKDEDFLIVAVIPKVPAKHLYEDFADDDNDLRFQLPESASWWKKKLFLFLHGTLMLPDILLLVIFSISLKAWFGIVLWFILAPIAHRLDLGPIYILGTGFTMILVNLGRRQDGDVSAYSIFNVDFRELPGTLNAERLDRNIRAGQF